MEIWELAARERIRETLARYAHCADRGRFEELVALFTEDGALDIEGRDPIVGRVAILDFVGRTKRSLAVGSVQPFIRHHVSSVRIDVESPSQARAASYFLAITDRGPDHWGRYRDELAQVGGLWLFRRRMVRVDGRAPQGWSATRVDP
jgi:hypothetical protein